MHIVLGATGHVGGAAAKALKAAGETVTVVTHDAAHAPELEAQGHVAAVADVTDVARLRDIFRTGRRAFLLNPPAAPTTDTDAEEKRTIAGMLEALDGSGLEKVVAASTYGAQPGEACGDLNTLWTLEEGLKRQSIPWAVNRGAYYFSNLDMNLEEVRQGVLRTMLPPTLALPMVAPRDLGEAAARRLMAPVDRTGVFHIEGPARHTVGDVAEAFARSLGTAVRVENTPREGWEEAFRSQGFSPKAARSYAHMTGATVDGGFIDPAEAERGPTTLQAYIDALVGRTDAAAAG